jgi:peptidoglycan/xylan/chitin deacetylase (PgdA/CDA1 family)
MLRLGKLLPALDKIKLLDLLVKLKSKNSILLVIMYHEVGRGVYYDEGIPEQLFEDEIKYLIKLRFKILPLCEALEVIEEEPDKSHRIAVLTFDDAYRGVYDNALPIMLRHGIRGSIYPVAGFVKNHIIHWASQIGFIIRNIKTPITIKLGIFNKMFTINSENDKITMLNYLLNILPKLDVNEISALINELIRNTDESINHALQGLYDEVMMNEEQLRELVELGFEIGGHGYWHVGLTNISRERLYQEVESSLAFVNEFMGKSGCKFRTFAYPYGLYNNEVINVLKEVGFHAAVSMKPIINKIAGLNLHEIGRVSPYRFNLPTLASFKAQLVITR